MKARIFAAFLLVIKTPTTIIPEVIPEQSPELNCELLFLSHARFSHFFRQSVVGM